LVEAHLREACEHAFTSSKISAGEVKSVCAGVAGVTSALRGEETIHAMLSGIFGCSIRVVDDVEIALEAAFRGAPGVAAVCGTGSIVRGRNAQGDRARAGGWGSAVSDEGSGTWIGKQAAHALLRACDMGDQPALLEKFYQAWGVADREEFVARCNAIPQPDFAALAPVVMQASDSDTLAAELLERAGRDFADTAAIVIGRLWMPFEAVKVAMLGGVFNGSTRVRRAFSLALISEFSSITVQLCENDPVEGALYLAEKALG
jgi:N-acetylglucosamine kinase-like BadF-type ATPase